MYRITELTESFAKALIEKHGGIAQAARVIGPEVLGANGHPATFSAIERRLHRLIRGEFTTTRISKDSADHLGRIAALLQSSGIDPEDVGRVHKIRLSSHKGFIKNKDQEIEYTDHLPASEIAFSPSWDEGPEWPVVQPAKPVIIKQKIPPPRARVGKTIVILPDVQIGFLRNIEDPSHLEPMHDPLALKLALHIVGDIQPDQLGWIGDFLDFSEMSRWLQVEEFWRTTQPAIDEGHRILAEFEAAGGPNREKTFFIAGNHDRRIREMLQKNARSAFHLRPAMETPKTWPDLTVPHLLRFEELHIVYCGEYPGSEYWLTEGLVVRHNPEKKDAYDCSVIAGHTHRIRQETFSRRTPNGPRYQTLWEIGCLCRVDNYADKSSLMRTSVPSDRGFVSHWTQGIAVVHIDDDQTFQVDQIQFHRTPLGLKAFHAGKIYEVHNES